MTPIELDEPEVLYLIHLLEPQVLEIQQGTSTQYPAEIVPLYQKLYAVAQSNLLKRATRGQGL